MDEAICLYSDIKLHLRAHSLHSVFALKIDAYVLTLQDAAKFFGVSPWTVRRWMEMGDLSYTKIGGRIRFTQDELIAYVEKRTSPAQPYHVQQITPEQMQRASAYRAVAKAIRTGVLLRAKALPCTDCGHRWERDGPKHEWDHHRGYAPDHVLDVQAVCQPCHRRREVERQRSKKSPEQ